MPDTPALIAPDGRVIDPRYIDAVRQSAQANVPGQPRWNARDGMFPYRAGDLFGREVADWHPWIRSPDSEINLHRDRMVARQRDLVRNDGWASGGVDRIVDNTIGASFRLMAEPDYMALGREDKRLDETWAVEFSEAVEAEWRMWADDVGCYCDSMRQLDITGIFRLALRSDLIDGESLIYLQWLPEFVGSYGARYATTALLVDSDRLSNPYQDRDTATMRGGVEIDAAGAPVAYHMRREEQNDYYNALESMVWDRLPRETTWKRPIIVHGFEKERATQHRGVGLMAAVLPRFKMLGIYDQTELEQAVQQAAIRTFITAPFHDEIENVLKVDGAADYQYDRADYHRRINLSIGGARIPALYPGENITTVQDDAKKSFAEFEAAVLRSIAARMGLSEGQLTQDYSRTNYSSARSALLESWKTLYRRRGTFVRRTVSPIYTAWLEEALSTRLRNVMPRNAPFFPEWRTAYARADWLGPPRGWVDPVKERQGAVLGLDAGFSTLKRECAEQGLDYKQVIRQRGIEVKMMTAEGLQLPDWAGMPAQEVEMKPEPQ
ncbi:MAG: phage portal protein [Janthinobacterium lividum]